MTKMTIEYFKKARGTVTAESRPVLPISPPKSEHDFTSEITDSDGDLVARATVRWKLDLFPGKTPQTAPSAPAARAQPHKIDFLRRPELRTAHLRTDVPMQQPGTCCER